MAASQGHSRASEIWAGIGLGVLVGVLLGLSVAEVVGGVVGGLAAMLAAFLGLSSIGNAEAASRTLRIASFGFACTLGVVLGVGARANNWLSEPIESQVARWKNAGASQADAVAYVAYQQLGIVPSGRTVGPPPKATPGTTALFASHDASECANLSPVRFPNVQTRLNAMHNAGDGWTKFADAAKNIPVEQLGGLLDAGYKLVCGD